MTGVPKTTTRVPLNAAAFRVWCNKSAALRPKPRSAEMEASKVPSWESGFLWGFAAAFAMFAGMVGILELAR